MRQPSPTREPWIAGVDGCPAGWVAVLWTVDGSQAPRVHVRANFADVLALPEAPARIAVDMPIGFAERVGPGGRACDLEARQRLGQRQSSVFTVPARAAVMQTDYRDACRVALAHSEPPRMVSKQCFHLFAKMREIDALLTPSLQDRVFECHPELAFWAMNGERPLDEPKKVKSKPYEPGLAMRRRLLRDAGMPEAVLQRANDLPRGVAVDDLLDAAACAWTARRAHLGDARRFPDEPPRDARGLRMEIWA